MTKKNKADVLPKGITGKDVMTSLDHVLMIKEIKTMDNIRHLQELNREVCSRIKQLRATEVSEIKKKLVIGQKVWVPVSRPSQQKKLGGKCIFGTITKIKSKRVLVETVFGSFRVPIIILLFEEPKE